MTRKQRGGALEPTRKVPPFKYTNNPDRQEIVRILYPYSTYFFALIKEIPWATFTSDHEGFQARTWETPYMVIGGAAYEAYDTLFPTMNPRVHDVLDPTADIDILISPLLVTSNTMTTYPTAADAEKEVGIYPLLYETTVEEENTETSFFGGIMSIMKDKEPAEIKTRSVLTPIMEDYTTWIHEQFAIAISKISYNFSQWFGKIPYPTKEFLPLVQEDEPSAIHVDVIPYHPIYILRMRTTNGVKVQVRFYNGAKLINFMECLFWKDAVINHSTVEIFPEGEGLIPYDLMTSRDGVQLNSFLYELYLQHDSVKNRIGVSKASNPYQFKFLNHIGRTMYLMAQFEKILTEEGNSLDESDRTFIQYHLGAILFICDGYKSTQSYTMKLVKTMGRFYPTLLELLQENKHIAELLQHYIEPPQGGARHTRRQRRKQRRIKEVDTHCFLRKQRRTIRHKKNVLRY